MNVLYARPLKYVDINHFDEVERFDLIQGNGGTFYFQLYLQLADRYVPAAGSTVSIVFPRSLSVASTPANQDVTVVCAVADSRDMSVYKFDLTAANVDKIVSEGVKLVVVENAVSKTYPVDHLVRRRSNVPGA